MPPADPPHAPDHPSLWRRAAAILLHPTPPPGWMVCSWLLACIVWAVLLFGAETFPSGRAGGPLMLLREPGGGPWEPRSRTQFAGLERWDVRATLDFRCRRAVRLTTEVTTLLREDVAGAPLPPETTAELAEVRAMLIKPLGDLYISELLSPAQRERLDAFLLDPGASSLTLWTPRAVLLAAADAAIGTLVVALTIIGAARITRMHRAIAQLELAQSQRCPACAYDLSASPPDAKCPECNTDYTQELLRLKRLFNLP